MRLTDNARIVSEQETGRADEETKEVCAKGAKFSPVQSCHDSGRFLRCTRLAACKTDESDEKVTEIKYWMRHKT